MYSLGMDLGTSTVKIVLMQNGTVEKYWLAVHHGRPLLCLRQGLSELAIGRDETLAVCVTGDNAGALLERCPVLSELGEIPAIVEGVRRLVPQAGSIIEIGSQGARFITEVQSRTPQFAANEHCAEQSSHKTVFAKVPAMGQIWRDFGHAFSFASSSSRGIYPSPSYLIWMCCTRFPLDLSGAST